MVMPRVHVDIDRLETLLSTGATRNQIAAILGVSRSTVDARISEEGLAKKPLIKFRQAGQKVRDVAPRAGAHNPFGLGVAR